MLLPAHASLAQQKIPDAARALFDSVNRERAERKLLPLKWDEGLERAARKHAERMAQEAELAHRLPGEADLATRAHQAGARFSHITENIATGADARKFHDGWMHSPGHRANILDADSNSIGIAVVEGEVDFYAVEDFAWAVAMLSIEEQEKRVGEILLVRGLHLIDLGSDARNSCELDRDFVGNSKAKYVAHYETSTIDQLPAPVERQIESHRYKSGAVGACVPKETSRFTSFRIVVLLY